MKIYFTESLPLPASATHFSATHHYFNQPTAGDKHNVNFSRNHLVDLFELDEIRTSIYRLINIQRSTSPPRTLVDRVSFSETNLSKFVHQQHQKLNWISTVKAFYRKGKGSEWWPLKTQ